MLNQLRRGASTWVAKVLIALLVLSFGIWGIADIFRGFGANQVARVGDTEITAVEFQRDYNRALQRLSQQAGRPIPADEAIQYGLPRQILGALATDALLTDAAKDYGIGVGDERVAASIRDDSTFQGPSGQFDRNRLQQILAANGMTEDGYIEDQRNLLERRQLVDGLFGGLGVPTVYLEAVNQYRNEERTIRYFTVDRDAIDAIPDPTDDELTSFYNEHKAEFAAPEYRALALLQANAETIANPSSISEEDAREVYDGSPNRFGTPETRHVQQVFFDDKARAQAAAQKLASGTPFEEILVSAGRTMSDVDLGTVDRSQIVDPAVAEAAFSLEGPGAEVVDGRFGTVLVRVSEINPGARQPFSEVESTIRQELAQQAAEREVLDLYDEVEDAFAGGATMQEVAKRFSIPLQMVPAVSASGTAPGGANVTLPAKDDLLSDAFDTEVGADNPPIQVGPADYVWYRVTDVTPARDRPLDEVRGPVIAAWTETQVTDKIATLAQDAAERVRNGESLEAVAQSIGAEVQTSEPFTRDGNAGTLPQGAVTAAFDGPQGSITDVAAADTRHLVIEVASVDRPAFFAEAADNEPARQRLQRSMGDALVGSYVAALERERPMEVNQQMLNQIVGAP
ncbi:SurA N-terminal domain-containing protein [Amorphus sp. 3PC139-8]|uniref:peptidylprolyl isomerase n=1 Tax=Amorphus sp. 3PC139-8 TaxID=2735676 RepID=UPI00345CA518